jgi:DNA polymerase-3 subunit beta
MKLTIEQPALVSALATVQGIIEKRNTLPILANVHMSAVDGMLTIRATDLDVEATTRVACDVDQEGETTVSGDLLASVVKKMPKGNLVSLSEDKGRLHVESGKTKIDFATLPPEDFPQLASEEYEASFEIATDELERLFKKASFAMSTEEMRYFLQGIYLHPTDDGITAVATDGHRLAKVWTDQKADFPGVIVPRKTVAEVVKVLSIGDVRVSISESKIRFEIGDTVITSKVIDANYVDYSRVIPQGLKDIFRADAVAFANAASLVAMVCEDRVRAVKLAVGADCVGFSVKGTHQAFDEVEAHVTGAECEMGFNVKYLADVLSQAEGGDVDFFYDGPGNPAVVRPTEDERFLAVLLPMRT